MRTKIKSNLISVLFVTLFAATACGGAATTTSKVDTGATPALAAGASVAAKVLTLVQAQLGHNSQQGTVDNAAAVSAATPAATTRATTAASAADSLQIALEGVYAQANPSVVYIVVSAGGNGFGSGGQASGSGFVYDQNGMIVTNAHVVEGAQNIQVVFADGSRQAANLVGANAANDLAVIQVARLPASARPLTLAADTDVQVGEFVAAFGSPFGEQGSMSFGIVSGLNRSMTSASSSRFARSAIGSALSNLIQTDAPINPGNSGGPLLNLQGQVVGISNAIESTTGSNAGVGLAIPVSVIRQVVPGIIANAG
jgi:S1-C subfamily serine protease